MYLVDSDILSYAMMGDGRVLTRFEQESSAILFVSSLTIYEISYGMEKVSRRDRLVRAFDGVRERVFVLAADAQVAADASLIRVDLEARGITIGMADQLIAATARVCGLTLVTHNVKHFEPIEGLEIEDWKSKG